MFNNSNDIRDVNDILLYGFYKFVVCVIFNIVLWLLAPTSLIITIYSIWIGYKATAYVSRKRIESK